MSLAAALDLYDAVVDLPPAARQAALDAADPEPRRLAEEMLAVETNSIRFRDAVGWKVQAGMRELLEAPDALPEDLPGFEVLGVLGQGGMGKVLDAEQHAPKRRVALKVIHPWLDSPGSRAWLRDEAQALGALLHPNIPQVYAFQETETLSFLVMEKVSGVSLMRWAQGRRPRARVQVLTQVAQAVAHAHARGFLHLDLKPGNVLVTAEDQPKVLDFGLSRTHEQGMEGTAGGTPAYMAPEQARQARLDVRADVFALGAVLWAVLRGERPPGGVVPALGEGPWPTDLAAIVKRATEQDPDRRYPTVEAMLSDLQAWLADRPVTAHAGGQLYRLGKALRRRPALWGAATLAALSLVVGTGVSVDRAQQAETARQDALQALAQAEAAQAQSEADAARARAASEFVSEVFLEMNPERTTGQKTVIEAANAAMARLDEGALAEAPQEANKLRVALAEAWMHQGELETAQKLTETVVAQYGPGGLPVDEHYVDALHEQLIMAGWSRDQNTIITAWPLALAGAVTLEDESRTADLLHSRAVTMSRLGDYAGAQALFEQAYARKVAMGDALPLNLLSNTVNQLGYLQYMRGDLEGAEAVFSALLERTQAGGEDFAGLQATCHHWLSQLALDQGDPEGALEELDQAMDIRDGLGIEASSGARSGELTQRTRILVALGELEQARAAWTAFEQTRRSTRPVARNDAKAYLELLIAEGDTAQAQRVVDAAYAWDVQAKEGTGSWAWAHTTRGLWRAHLGHPGAAEDIEKALSVWEPRFGPQSGRVLELEEALAGLANE